MGRVISFINEKGGIGKTSCCFNIAWEISKRKKVLMIDMDGQRANLTYFAGIDKDSGVKTMFDVLKMDVPMSEITISISDNLFIIPGTVNVASLDSTAKVTRMKKAIQEVIDTYDYIFIDVNPTPNWSHVLTLSTCNYIIIPMLPDVATLEANKGIAESVEELLDTTNPNLKVLGLLFNKYTERTNLSKEVTAIANTIAKQLDSKVFKHTIRNAVKLSENVAPHIGITDYDPNSNVAKDVIAVVKELEQEIKKIEEV